MPKATVSTATTKYWLKTLSEGNREAEDPAEQPGFVVLKRMTWGQKLHRQQMATNQSGEITGKRMTKLDIELMSRKVAEYEFKHCIAEHNLTDEQGNLLNFQDPRSLDVLDPRVGDEINKYIAEQNNFEDDEEDQKGN